MNCAGTDPMLNIANPAPEEIALRALPEQGIDRVALNRLRLDCGEEFAAVCEVFAAELKGIVSAMAGAVADEDLAALSRCADALRGSAATFALHGLRQTAMGIGTACSLGEKDQVRRLANEAKSLAEDALKALRRELGPA